jgi:hypothetical protein
MAGALIAWSMAMVKAARPRWVARSAWQKTEKSMAGQEKPTPTAVAERAVLQNSGLLEPRICPPQSGLVFRYGHMRRLAAVPNGVDLIAVVNVRSREAIAAVLRFKSDGSVFWIGVCMTPL